MADKTSFNQSVLWDEKAVAQYLGVSVQFLQQDRHRRRRIPFVRIGRAIRYKPDDVRAFVESARVSPLENPKAA